MEYTHSHTYFCDVHEVLRVYIWIWIFIWLLHSALIYTAPKMVEKERCSEREKLSKKRSTHRLTPLLHSSSLQCNESMTVWVWVRREVSLSNHFTFKLLRLCSLQSGVCFALHVIFTSIFLHSVRAKCSRVRLSATEHERTREQREREHWHLVNFKSN